MYMFINALILALLIPAEGVQKVEDGPACRAQLTGENLLTTIEFPTGLKVEGPWRVLHRAEIEDNLPNYIMYATLDRVIETDELTGGHHIIPFPEPVSLSFEGPDQEQLVQRAAQVWCVTAMRAKENQKLERLSPTRTFATRVAFVPTDDPSA
jgi:hypothetical protein